MRTMTFRTRAFTGALIASLALSDAAQSGQLTIDHLGMKPNDVSYTTTYTAKWDGGLRTVQNLSTCFSAGVHLPHGATIARIFVTYSSGATTTPYAALIRNKLASEEYRVVADASLADNTGKRRTFEMHVDESYATIDNSRYSYGFGICLGEKGGDTFYTVRFAYTPAK